MSGDIEVVDLDLTVTADGTADPLGQMVADLVVSTARLAADPLQLGGAVAGLGAMRATLAGHDPAMNELVGLLDALLDLIKAVAGQVADV